MKLERCLRNGTKVPIKFNHLFYNISEFQWLKKSFYAASKSKQNRLAIMKLSVNLEKNLFAIQSELREGTYQFGPYRSFWVEEPKKRLIESARFRDRIVHHAIHSVLEPIFDAQFYYHSYACRTGRGSHEAVITLQNWMRHAPSAFYLKCDIKKYFQSVDRNILLNILGKTIKDERLLELLERLIMTGPSSGIPIGNLTSQLFANLYLNELDQFLKRKLRIKKYIRYMDDFVMLIPTKDEALLLRNICQDFLKTNLNLELSPHKVQIDSVKNGISFLGFQIFPNRLHLRNANFRRMRRKIKKSKSLESTKFSYLGTLLYCSDFFELHQKLLLDNSHLPH